MRVESNAVTYLFFDRPRSKSVDPLVGALLPIMSFIVST